MTKRGKEILINIVAAIIVTIVVLIATYPRTTNVEKTEKPDVYVGQVRFDNKGENPFKEIYYIVIVDIKEGYCAYTHGKSLDDTLGFKWSCRLDRIEEYYPNILN